MRLQRNSRWVLIGCCGFIGLLWSVAAQAQVVTIPPTPPSGSVTVSLFQVDGTGALVDVTGTYLPRVNEVVYVKMSDGSAPVLVPHSTTAIPALSTLAFPFTAAAVASLNPYLTEVTTSAYQGEATNYPSTASNVAPPARTGDFVSTGNTVSIGSSTAYGFMALDYGGMLVVQAGGVKFIIPKDSNLNGIADSWEAPYGGGLVREADIDPGPGGNTVVGDGFSNFDEYRGAIVSGQHVRTSPLVKNLFVHLVNPQCVTGSATSYLGGGAVTHVPTDILFNNLDTLTAGTRVSALGVAGGVSTVNTNEWVDHFVSYSEETKLNTYASGTDGTVSDRRVNQNAVYPLADGLVPVAQKYFQKGLRVTECLDGTMPANLASTVLGVAGLGSANGPDNATIYTQRIINWVNAKLAGATPKVSTYVNGAWTSAATTTNEDIYKKMIQYVVAMEVGHSVKLTPTVEGTRKTSYGYHHAPGTGTNMDLQANFSSPTFSIPSLFGVPDQSSFKVRN